MPTRILSSFFPRLLAGDPACYETARRLGGTVLRHHKAGRYQFCFIHTQKLGHSTSPQVMPQHHSETNQVDTVKRCRHSLDAVYHQETARLSRRSSNKYAQEG